jgi:LCP family protein required for cell wall assembly
VRIAVLVIVVLLVLALAWPIGLAVWSNKKIQHTAALSSAASTPGTTYLLAGSDARGDGGIAQDGTLGARTDTILLLHVPEHGPTALISLPRDTYVRIDGHGPAKLNAAFAWGGAPLLVHTVEQLTGMKIDHYAEIGLGGVKEVVDAVGGVNLCYNHDVNDADSGMVWTSGCHDVNGTQALAYSRMRKADPEGDIGREKRQRQLIGAVMGKLSLTSLVWHPSEQVKLIDAGTAALTLDSQANIHTLASLAMAFRAANRPGGVTGTPPIKSLNYQPGNVGSTVLLDPAKAPAFWQQVRDGKLAAGTVGGIPG